MPDVTWTAWLSAKQADTDYQDALARLKGATPAQIRTYVQNNVTDLASAKALLAKILIFLSMP